MRRSYFSFSTTLLLIAALVVPLLIGSVPVRAQSPAAGADDILIQGGTVLTITNGMRQRADVLVRDGVIAEIGADLEAPDGVEVYDATGMYVMPGIIDAHSHIAISNVNEATNPVTAEVGVGDVLDPFEVELYRALAGGVTVSHVMHGSANPIGGQNETIKHRYGVINPDALRMDGAPRTIKFALGENPTRVHGEGNDIIPDDADGRGAGDPPGADRCPSITRRRRLHEAGERPAPPAHSERLEVLAGILSGDVLVHCHSYRADEILMLMNVLGDFGVEDITFQHVNEGFKVAPELAELWGRCVYLRRLVGVQVRGLLLDGVQRGHPH